MNNPNDTQSNIDIKQDQFDNLDCQEILDVIYNNSSQNQQEIIIDNIDNLKIQQITNKNQSYPTLHEIQKSLSTLKIIFPDLFTEQIIYKLNQMILNKNNLNIPINPVPNPILNQQPKPMKSISIPKQNIIQKVTQTIKKSSLNKSISNHNSLKFNQKLYNSLYNTNKQYKNKYKNKIQTISYTPTIPINKKIKNPIYQIQPTPRNYHIQLQHIWNPQFEKILLSLYISGKKYSKIKDYLQNQFPKYSEIFTTNSIKCKFLKIIRIAIRQLQQHIVNQGNNKLPLMIRLNDQMIKQLMYRLPFYDIRIMLIKIYNRQQCDYKLLRQTIDKINKAFSNN